MRSSRWGVAKMKAWRVRRSVAVIAAVAVGGLTALNPRFVRGLFDGVYPIDPARRKALTLCFEQDQRFNRLDAGQRDDCYRRMLFSLGDVAGDASATPAPVNIIDLQRAAGQGGMIHNDIRQQEATQGALHSPH